jgi:CheY-like chemotaxis protein
MLSSELARNLLESAAPAPDSRPHVLLVEDDDLVRKATARLLNAEGYRVTTASSLPEAIACLGDVSCDVGLLITDYHLGNSKTGIDIVSVARERLGSDFKAVVVTGDTSSEIRDLKRDQHLRVISKPIDADELLAILAALTTA